MCSGTSLAKHTCFEVSSQWWLEECKNSLHICCQTKGIADQYRRKTHSENHTSVDFVRSRNLGQNTLDLRKVPRSTFLAEPLVEEPLVVEVDAEMASSP